MGWWWRFVLVSLWRLRAFLAACFRCLCFCFVVCCCLAFGFGGYNCLLLARLVCCWFACVGCGARVQFGGGGCLRIACFWFGVGFRFGVFCFCGLMVVA